MLQMPMVIKGAKILVVEDDSKIALALRNGLESEGFTVTCAVTGEDAFFLLNSEDFNLVLLDWMLPGKSGPEILRVLRSKDSHIPVILVTARDSIDDRVVGLDAGADDYLLKPFAFPELLARMRVLLRRGERESQASSLHVRDLTVNLLQRKVNRADVALELTVREFDLLVYLMQHSGQIVSREMLAKDVWKESSRVTSLDNVIDVHITRLRKKIDAEAAFKLIETIRGVGFRISGGGP